MLIRCILSTCAILTAMTMHAASHGNPKDFDEGKLQVEMKRLQGTWRCVATESGGRQVERGEIAEHRLVISGSECALHSGKRVTAYTMRIDPDASPMRIDLQTKSGDETIHGIYRFDGVRLSLMVDYDPKQRPVEFRTKPGSQQVLRTFERIEP